MQTGYEYTLSEPVGKNFSDVFVPELTPGQMLELGVFGGRKAGSTGKIPGDGFNGTAGILWVGDALMIPGKSSDGDP